MKKILILIFALIFLPACAHVDRGLIQGAADDSAANDYLKIIYFDVGQGDAALIDTPGGRQILVDGGPDASILEKLADYLSFNDNYLDVVVLTHPHADHVDGLVEVLKRYAVGEIWLTGVVHTSSKYLEFLNLIKEKNIPTRVVFTCPASDKQITIDNRQEAKTSGSDECVSSKEIEPGLDIFFLWPDHDLSGERVENLNDSSIVFRLAYQDNSFFFAGDAEAGAEQGMILSFGQADPSLFKSDVLKVGHHGSGTSSIQEFLDLIDPDYAVVSVARENSYNLPSLRTIRRIERQGGEVLRTDESGDIVFVSDGQKISFTTTQSLVY